MKSSNFLNKLGNEGKLEIVESSEQMSLSYEKKGAECREVAQFLPEIIPKRTFYK